MAENLFYRPLTYPSDSEQNLNFERDFFLGIKSKDTNPLLSIKSSNTITEKVPYYFFK